MKIVKLAFINPDGEINRIYKKEEDMYHIKYYMEYLEENFLDDEEMQNIDYSDTPDKVGLMLKDRGYMVLVNVSSYDKNDSEKAISSSMILMMPDTLTEKQIDRRKDIIEELDKFGDKWIWYDYYKDENNCTNCHSMHVSGDSSEKMVNQAIDYMVVNNVKKSK